MPTSAKAGIDRNGAAARTDTRGRSVVYELLEQYCAEHGLHLTAGDSRGHAGCIEDGRGKRWFFKGTRFDINPLGSAEIANDKAYSLHFLEQAGVRVPESLLVFAQDVRTGRQLPADILQFVEDHGFPLFLKPNIGQEGQDVFRIHGFAELSDMLHRLSGTHPQLLLQPEMSGRDLRVIILDGDVLCAVERRAAQVTGDGRQSIATLIGAHTRIAPSDGRIDAALAHQGLTRDSVPGAGDRVALLPVTNLSTGGTADIVTGQLAPGVLDAARKAAAVLGLRYAGVDMILTGSAPHTAEAVILEVNAAPGLSNLYRQGPGEAACVGAIYGTLFSRLFAK
ncbi:ATP-grasp domain-containing protein [Roseibium sp.]|uniref:ATP-grasp domain-containing protein n=1 Tax=Roseibium sp. TaxID=1936156 RepID=UPI003BAD515A